MKPSDQKNEKKIKKVAVTGAAGQVAYSLVFRIAAGDLFGLDQPVSLHLLDLPMMSTHLEGVKFELEDGNYPLLKNILIGDKPEELFEGVDYALLLGASPRGPGMERKDLIEKNSPIFISQGIALDRVASKDVKIIVVGNPCNTNCWIVKDCTKNLSPSQFFAMTRLDHNRALFQLANKAGTGVEKVKKMTIWGNHSSTQVPDFTHVEINSFPLSQVISDESWLKTDFFKIVQSRGAEIIRKRGYSSAASAAEAVIHTVHDIERPTPENDWYSLAIPAIGNPYGIDEDLIFSFPCRTDANGKVSIVSGLEFSPFIQQKIKETEMELKDERSLVKQLINKR